MPKDYTLIIGAGASKALSSKFGLGNDLLREISERVTDKTTPDGHYLSQVLDNAGLKQAVREDFLNSLEQYMKTVKPGSIDGFLDEVATYPEYAIKREDFLKIGKYMIMMHIHGYEGAMLTEYVANYPEKSWIDVLAHFIDGEKILERDVANQKKLKIITFNYDRIVERYLFDHPKFKTKTKELNEFFNASLVHVYGKLGNLQEQNATNILKFGDPNAKPQEIYEKSDNIRTMYDERSGKTDFPAIAKEWLHPVHNDSGLNILSFGFAFDPINSSLLSLQELGIFRKQQIIANIYSGEDTDFSRRRTEAARIRSINFDSKLSYESCDDFLRKYLI